MTAFVANRRGALAALLAGAAGVHAAQGRIKGKDKRNRGKKKGKKGNNRPGAGDGPASHVTYVIHDVPMPNHTGEVTAAADCPAGSVPIGGHWAVAGVTGASLIHEDILLTDPVGWEVTVDIPTASPDTVVSVLAICLNATFDVEEE